MSKLWGGRFTGKTDPVMERFNNSLDVDKVMWDADIVGSIEYSRSLEEAGVLTSAEGGSIRDGLALVREEWAKGIFVIKEGDEDIHTANERRLTEIIGAAGGKVRAALRSSSRVRSAPVQLRRAERRRARRGFRVRAGRPPQVHTGRSRNDQVVTDLRLHLRSVCAELAAEIKALVAVAAKRAEHEIDILMPGYTHMQSAQPVRWAHWMLAHAQMWRRDHSRLVQAAERMNECPLGSGALAGHPFGLERTGLATRLGFDRPTANSMDAVSDRDFVVELSGWASLLMAHFSRFAEDIIIFSTQATAISPQLEQRHRARRRPLLAPARTSCLPRMRPNHAVAAGRRRQLATPSTRLRPRTAAQPPPPSRRRAPPSCAGVRLRQVRRLVLYWLVADAAEEEPGRGRAAARQG
jgi:argininosuccinate lyase